MHQGLHFSQCFMLDKFLQWSSFQLCISKKVKPLMLHYWLINVKVRRDIIRKYKNIDQKRKILNWAFEFSPYGLTDELQSLEMKLVTWCYKSANSWCSLQKHWTSTLVTFYFWYCNNEDEVHPLTHMESI